MRPSQALSFVSILQIHIYFVPMLSPTPSLDLEAELLQEGSHCNVDER